MWNSGTGAARTPGPQGQPKATGLAAKPWEPARPAVAAGEAPFCPCSNSLCRNDSTSRRTGLLLPVRLRAHDRGALRPNQRHAEQDGQQPFHTYPVAVTGPGSR